MRPPIAARRSLTLPIPRPPRRGRSGDPPHRRAPRSGARLPTLPAEVIFAGTGVLRRVLQAFEAAVVDRRLDLRWVATELAGHGDGLRSVNGRDRKASATPRSVRTVDRSRARARGARRWRPRAQPPARGAFAGARRRQVDRPSARLIKSASRRCCAPSWRSRSSFWRSATLAAASLARERWSSTNRFAPGGLELGVVVRQQRRQPRPPGRAPGRRRVRHRARRRQQATRRARPPSAIAPIRLGRLNCASVVIGHERLPDCQNASLRLGSPRGRLSVASRFRSERLSRTRRGSDGARARRRSPRPGGRAGTRTRAPPGSRPAST